MTDYQLLWTRVVNNNFHFIDPLVTHTIQLITFCFLILCKVFCGAVSGNGAGRSFHRVGPTRNVRLSLWGRSLWAHDQIKYFFSCIYMQLNKANWEPIKLGQSCLQENAFNCLESTCCIFMCSIMCSKVIYFLAETKKIHRCKDVQLYSFIPYTDMYRSLSWPPSGCRTIGIKAIHLWFHKMREKNLLRFLSI